MHAWLVAQSCRTLCDPMDCSPPGSSVHGYFPGKKTGMGLPCPPPGDLPNLGIELRSPALQVDPLPFEPEGKPKSAGVGSLSLLPGIFPTQEVNWGLLHCRWIPYQLSYHLLSYKKEQNCVICKDMDGPRDCHTE